MNIVVVVIGVVVVAPGPELGLCIAVFEAVSTSSNFGRNGVLQHHQLVHHTLVPCTPLCIIIGPSMVNIKFGKHNFLTDLTNHVVWHGESLSVH